MRLLPRHTFNNTNQKNILWVKSEGLGKYWTCDPYLVKILIMHFPENYITFERSKFEYWIICFCLHGSCSSKSICTNSFINYWKLNFIYWLRDYIYMKNMYCTTFLCLCLYSSVWVFLLNLSNFTSNMATKENKST